MTWTYHRLPEGVEPKYKVAYAPHPKTKNPTLTLTPEQEEAFKRLYPVKTMEQLVVLFGVSESTIIRWRKLYQLEKSKSFWKRKCQRAADTMRKNGHYDRIEVSHAARNAYLEKLKTGYHPLKEIKKTNPRRYKRMMQRRSEKRKELIAQERKRVNIGLPQHTRLQLPQVSYTRRQVLHRHSASNKGYILGDTSEDSGERYTIYYDADTKRGKIFEKNLIKNGFRIKQL